MLEIAFKEWAVVCKALVLGQQSLILRKGGIAEVGGEFRPEYSRFWLYPTYLHEHRAGIKPEYMPLFDQAVAEHPPPGTVRLSHFVEVTSIRRFADWAQVEALNDQHIWSPSAVRAKFDYRTPGLFVLTVQVFPGAKAIELKETPEYAGCKSWVKLERELPE